MVFRDGDKGHGIYQPDGGSPFCVDVRPDIDGTYYLSAVTAAPHGTEHNDLWLRFPTGVYRYRPQRGSIRAPSSNWLKGYQNEGQEVQTDYLLNVNHDGHQFVTTPLRAGQTYSLCVAGRSTMFEIFKLTMVVCEAGENAEDSVKKCSRFLDDIRRKMSWLPPSPC